MITIPPSLQAEHKSIHDALMEATRVPGPVGAAARELAAGEKPAGMDEALDMSQESLGRRSHLLSMGVGNYLTG